MNRQLLLTPFKEGEDMKRTHLLNRIRNINDLTDQREVRYLVKQISYIEGRDPEAMQIREEARNKNILLRS